MIVTSIKQRSPGRLTVCLEDGSEILSTLGAVTDMRLYAGRDIDDDAVEELRQSSALSIARERALEIVSRRRMSGKELRDKLLQKGESEDTADRCVTWLTERGFIDDEGYAAAVVRHYAAKGYGEGRIRAELSRRGVARELWDDALEAMPDNTDKLTRYIAAHLSDPEDRAQLRKLSQALLRRGYSWGEIRAALNAFNADTEEY